MDGKSISGEVNAENETEARVKLRAQYLIPIKLKQKGSSNTVLVKNKQSGSHHTVKLKELQIFTRQFSVLVASGVPILQGIEAMAQGSKSPGMVAVLNDMALQLNKGRRLYEALALHPKAFDNLYINLVRAGEEGGVLEAVLVRLADHIEKTIKLNGKIKGAMVYPLAIIVVAFIVVAVIMIFVIPSFVDMFSQNGAELPWLTQKVIDASDFTTQYWYLIVISITGSVFSIKGYYRTTAGKELIDQYLIMVPVLGSLIQKGAIASFSRTLATMLRAGVKISESLEIAASTVGNDVIAKAIRRSKAAIERGRALVEPLKKEKYIPVMVTQMISIGEQTGNLDTMLEKIADFYEDEVDVAASALTSLMEPILMVVIGGIIAILVVAMYLPIFQMADAVM